MGYACMFGVPAVRRTPIFVGRGLRFPETDRVRADKATKASIESRIRSRPDAAQPGTPIVLSMISGRTSAFRTSAGT
jgi:hypothetical protein